MTELPLFPLSGVLLPYGRMPLQIFEPRYLDLVRDCMKTDSAFGVVWIRRGAEVAQPGGASPLLGDYGTSARIIDWDQLPNGLVVGQVEFRPPLAPAEFESGWQTLLDVLRSLETHPHVQRMELQVDYRDAWQVAYTLIQLLPLEEALKYELLGLDSIDALMAELDTILNQISGEDQD